MVVPLVILAFFAVVAGWNLWRARLRPGAAAGAGPAGGHRSRGLGRLGLDHRHASRRNTAVARTDEAIHVPATFWAFGAALGGFLLATAFYGLRVLDPEDVRRQFAPSTASSCTSGTSTSCMPLFVRPTLRISGWVAAWTSGGSTAWPTAPRGLVAAVARLDDWIDRLFVDGLVERIARGTYALGLRLRAVQTGNLRQYVMLIAVGTVALLCS